MTRSAFVKVLLLFLVFSVCGASAGVSAEVIEVYEDGGWFGVYIDNKKVGWAGWTLERLGEGEKGHYKILWTEERTISGKKHSFNHKALIGKDFKMKSLESEIKRPGSILSIIGKGVAEGVSIEAAMGKTKMPARYIKTKDCCMWSFCAPLCFGWRCPEPKGLVAFGRIYEQGYTELRDDLTPERKTIKFQGEDIECVEWAGENRKVVITVDIEGRLLNFTEKTKTSSTMLICEPKNVAKSSKKFEDFDGSFEDEEETVKEEPKNDNDKKPEKRNKGKVEGDDDGMFDGCLKPVDDDEDESKKGDYLKVNEEFSIRALKGWSCEEGVTEDSDFGYRVECDKDDEKRIFITFFSFGEDDVETDLEDDDAVEKMKSWILPHTMFVILHIMSDYGVNGTNMPEEGTRFKFADGEYLFGYQLTLVGQKRWDACSFLAQNSSGVCQALAFCPEGTWDDNKEEFCKMIGSFRAID
ncbi:MAG: hypothetical protein Kow00107_06890 [Planctomycetota bacterium]